MKREQAGKFIPSALSVQHLMFSVQRAMFSIYLDNPKPMTNN
jgi:hypothetical protein